MSECPPIPGPALSAVRLLYAEDCESNVMLFELYLKHTPFVMTVAEDGQQAVEKFLAEPFDVVIMDIQMPVMDGCEATQAIRRHEADTGRARTPIIAITAYASKKNEEQAAQAGCDVFLTKPVRKAQLIELIQKWGGKPD